MNMVQILENNNEKVLQNVHSIDYQDNNAVLTNQLDETEINVMVYKFMKIEEFVKSFLKQNQLIPQNIDDILECKTKIDKIQNLRYQTLCKIEYSKKIKELKSFQNQSVDTLIMVHRNNEGDDLYQSQILIISEIVENQIIGTDDNQNHQIINGKDIVSIIDPNTIELLIKLQLSQVKAEFKSYCTNSNKLIVQVDRLLAIVQVLKNDMNLVRLRSGLSEEYINQVQIESMKYKTQALNSLKCQNTALEHAIKLKNQFGHEFDDLYNTVIKSMEFEMHNSSNLGPILKNNHSIHDCQTDQFYHTPSRPADAIEPSDANDESFFRKMDDNRSFSQSRLFYNDLDQSKFNLIHKNKSTEEKIINESISNSPTPLKKHKKYKNRQTVQESIDISTDKIQSSMFINHNNSIKEEELKQEVQKLRNESRLLNRSLAAQQKDIEEQQHLKNRNNELESQIHSIEDENERIKAELESLRISANNKSNANTQAQSLSQINSIQTPLLPAETQLTFDLHNSSEFSLYEVMAKEECRVLMFSMISKHSDVITYEALQDQFSNSMHSDFAFTTEFFKSVDDSETLSETILRKFFLTFTKSYPSKSDFKIHHADELKILIFIFLNQVNLFKRSSENSSMIVDPKSLISIEMFIQFVKIEGITLCNPYRAFHRMDLNKDGNVTFEDLATLLAYVKISQEWTLSDKMASWIDRNVPVSLEQSKNFLQKSINSLKTGITSQVFANWVTSITGGLRNPSQQKKLGNLMRQVFKNQLDENGNKILDNEEFRKNFWWIEMQFEAYWQFRYLSTTTEGKVSNNEFKNRHQELILPKNISQDFNDRFALFVKKGDHIEFDQFIKKQIEIWDLQIKSLNEPQKNQIFKEQFQVL